MSYTTITIEMEKRLKAIGSFPTAWENSKYKPTVGTAYQRVNFLPVPTENPTIGDGYKREIGIMQVTLFYPENKGKKDSIARAEVIKAQFPRGWGVTTGNIRLFIEDDAYISQGFNNEGWYVTPVSIRFTVDVFN